MTTDKRRRHFVHLGLCAAWLFGVATGLYVVNLSVPSAQVNRDIEGVVLAEVPPIRIEVIVGVVVCVCGAAWDVFQIIRLIRKDGPECGRPSVSEASSGNL